MKKFIYLLAFIISLPIYSQNFTMFDIDDTDFPTMRAKFYAFDENGNQILNLSPADFELSENIINRNITNISCPTPKPPEAISSVLVIDASVSMFGKRLEIAKVAAKSWILGLPLGKSECAITAFNHSNYFIQDFTKDRNLLIEKANSLFADGGTNYDAALINPQAGGLIVSKDGFYKNVIVMLTDGMAPDPQTSTIIAEAKAQGVTVYAVTLDKKCPQSLKDISTQTGGMWFEKVSTIEEARNIYLQILNIAQGGDPCIIEWESDYTCITETINILVKLKNMFFTTSYFTKDYIDANLEIKPKSVYFINKEIEVKHDTTISVTAINADFNILNIKSNNPLFEITPTNFQLKKGESKEITISFIPNDSGYIYCKYEFETDFCSINYFAAGLYLGKRPNVNTLKLTHPIGDEKFVVGIDTVITWDGIPATDTCTLEYSIDNGQTWKLITKNATGLRYEWKNIPKPTSEGCLIRIKQPENGKSTDSIPQIEWQRTYGGSDIDVATNIQLTPDNGYIIIGSTDSDNGDVTKNKGYTDIWVLKLNNKGDIEWQYTYGGESYDIGHYIQNTDDNGYIFVASVMSNNGDIIEKKGILDIWLVNINFSGEIVWQKTIGCNKNSTPVSIHKTLDNGYIIGSYISFDGGDVTEFRGSRDIWIIKVDNNGNIQWEKTFGGSSTDYFGELDIINNGFLIVGRTESDDGDIPQNKGWNDIVIYKLDILGNIIWVNTYGGSSTESASNIYETLNGDIIVLGDSFSNDFDVNQNKGRRDIWIFKTDELGNLIWGKTYGGSDNEHVETAILTEDGNVVVVCTTLSNDGDIETAKGGRDIWLIKINQDGKLLWQKTIGGSKDDIGHSIQQTFDGGYILAGSTASKDGDVTDKKGEVDLWVVKLSADLFILQEDTSELFSIVEPIASARDIDMLQVQVGHIKDSVVSEFVANIGSWKFRVDSIYFQGPDADAFDLVSGEPQYIVDANSSHFAEFRFVPNRIGIHTAEIVIITQADTLFQNIHGEGVLPSIEVITDIIDFGKIYVGQHKDTLQAITIKNVSNSPINITNIRHSVPNYVDFTTLAGAEPFVIQPGDTHKMDLRFAPSSVGRTSGTLEFHYEGYGGPAVVQLYGEGLFDGEFMLTLQALNIEGEPSEIVELPIILAEQENLEFSSITSMSVDLTYNSTLLYPIGFSAVKIDEFTSKITIDEIPIKYEIGDTLSTVNFIVGLGNTEQSNLELSNGITQGSNITFSYINGQFTLLGICYEGDARLLNPNSQAGILSITPNPAENILQIDFALIEKGQTEISIINSLGETVKNIFSKKISEYGYRSEVVDLKDLSSGQYILIFKSPTIIESKNIRIIK